MNHDEYTRACLTTWSHEGATKREQIDHATMGLAAEVREYAQALTDTTLARGAEELGDCTYYAAMLSHLIGHDPTLFLDHHYSHREHVSNLEAYTIKLMDAVVKWQHHGRENQRSNVTFWATQIWQQLRAHAKDFGELPHVFSENADKLKKRHPDGFQGEGIR